MISYEGIINFVREQGNQAFLGEDDTLIKHIDWFASKRRLFLIKSKGALLALCAFVVMDTTEKLGADKWPDDNPNGEFLWIPYIVLHPILRDNRKDKLRGRFFMRQMLTKGVNWFPNIKYLVYHKARQKKWKVVEISKFLKLEVSNV